MRACAAPHASTSTVHFLLFQCVRTYLRLDVDGLEQVCPVPTLRQFRSCHVPRELSRSSLMTNIHHILLLLPHSVLRVPTREKRNTWQPRCLKAENEHLSSLLQLEEENRENRKHNTAGQSGRQSFERYTRHYNLSGMKRRQLVQETSGLGGGREISRLGRQSLGC